MDATYRIVVGVDGSEGGRRALRWAVREAATRGGTVQAVTAWMWEATEASLLSGESADSIRQRSEQMLTEEISAVLHDHPAAPVASEAVSGWPAQVLTDAARDADLLVLGSHGHSRLRHMVLGSVAEACMRSATCPVVIVPTLQPEPVRHPAEVARAE